ncbi:hypothetical protein RD792_006142 [Penstemon davidsonii]|uniref:Non-haem dioxygenase N-terminal domain-containing protein n=1 Tax=Penstemon davidsonii TaxID=160366 RepID=A0ABR0DDE3_9LAMI|nr:hypothetical protein RD792_006142 [Penstemon davidsonii]
MSGTKKTLVENENRMKELKAFEDTKSGVKGLLDSGILTIPKIFIRSQDELAEESNYGKLDIQIPVIDLMGIETTEIRKEIVSKVRRASKDWGFFRVVNHGIPLTVLNDMLEGIRLFHEQDAVKKQEFYSRDYMKKVRYGSNVDLYRSGAANWRDSLTISLMFLDYIEPDELPEILRNGFLRLNIVHYVVLSSVRIKTTFITLGAFITVAIISDHFHSADRNHSSDEHSADPKLNSSDLSLLKIHQFDFILQQQISRLLDHKI